ncbi:MAG: ABC transporter ATP-binding protein [Clostridiales bacterium]|nr:ABC transporter ATP-binding protein [Clostridiales bacterium]
MSKHLHFHHVTKRFGAQTVLLDFSLELPLSCVSCLMGPSGSGKTTLLNLLMGLVQPDSGSVQTIHPQSAVFQEDRLLPQLSALGNLRLITGGGKDAELLHLLAELGIGEEGHKPVRDFSGGMQRRVVIARALIAEYELLLLDEPFKGLDADTRARTAEVIRRASQGKTVVMVTHDPTEAALLNAQVFWLPAI